MCTTATLEVAGTKSPVFEMHGETRGWSATLQPGERATLTVSFDPNAHGPEGLGRAVRFVEIFSNARDNPVGRAQITANVVER
jgi:hypothetical protein